MRKTMRGMKKAGMSGTMFDREAAMAKVWIGCGVDMGMSHRQGLS